MPTPHSALFCLPFLILAAAACQGQPGEAPVTLRVLDETPVTSLPHDIRGYRTVAGEGEFYFQALAGNYLAISLKGEVRVALDLSKVPASNSIRPDGLFLVDLAPAPRGGVLAITTWTDASRESQYGLLRFDEDGDYDDLIPLDTGFTPAHVAEFSSSGGFLLSGYDDSGKTRLALLDTRGKVLVPEVLRSSSSNASGRSGSAEAKKPGAQTAAVKSGVMQLASGDDDAVYVFDPSWGRKAIRVRSGGQFTEMALPQPAFLKNTSTMPLQMLISHGSLYLCEAILDTGKKPGDAMELRRFTISVYDRYSGALAAFYRVDSAFGSTPVAAYPREFFFLHARNVPGQGLNFSIVRMAP